MPIDSLGTFIAKLDSGGILQWHRTMGFYTIRNIKANTGGAVLFLKDNKSLVFLNVDRRKVIFNSAIFEEGWHAVELDLNGIYLSKTKFPFIDYQRSPATCKTANDNQGNYYFHGHFPGDTLFLVNDTLVRNSQNLANGLVLAIDSLGNYKWSFISQNNYDPFTDGVIAGDTILISSQVSISNVDTVKFGCSNYEPNSQFGQESILLYLNPNNANVIGLKHSNGKNNSSSSSYGIAANQDFMAISGKFDYKMTFVDSSIYVAGFFNDTLFVQGDTLIAGGSNDVFLARYDLLCDKGITVGIKENNNFIKAENGVLV